MVESIVMQKHPEDDPDLPFILPCDVLYDVRQVDARLDREKAVKRALAALPGRERMILEMRFGLNGEQEMSYSLIAQKLKLKDYRVKRIEVGAIKRLRHPLKVKGLKSVY